MPTDTARAGATPPFGTARRIRTRSIWAVALFTASLPPAFVFWAIGLLFALWAAFPTSRYWDGLPGPVRWLGSLPLLSGALSRASA